MTVQSPIQGQLSLGELLDRAFRLYRAHFGVMAGASAILLAPLGIVSALATGQFMVRYVDFLGQMLNASQQTDPFLDGAFASTLDSVALLLLLGLVNWVVTNLTTLTLSGQSVAALHGDSPGLGSGLRIGARG